MYIYKKKRHEKEGKQRIFVGGKTTPNTTGAEFLKREKFSAISFQSRRWQKE